MISAASLIFTRAGILRFFIASFRLPEAGFSAN
jgi:hypothetical protein